MSPLYDYRCSFCGEQFEEFKKVAARNRVKCSCGHKAKMLVSSPAVLITDSSFCMTGRYDNRLDGGRIEGRVDWNRRLKQKGYMELTDRDIQDGIDKDDKWKPVTDI